MKQKIKDMWVKELRSGKYAKGKTRLRNKDNTWCCLGVLTDIYRKTQKKGKWESVCDGSKECYQYRMNAQGLCKRVATWAGLELSMGGNIKLGNSDAWAVNDAQCDNFDQVADIIEKNL